MRLVFHLLSNAKIYMVQHVTNHWHRVSAKKQDTWNIQILRYVSRIAPSSMTTVFLT